MTYRKSHPFHTSASSLGYPVGAFQRPLEASQAVGDYQSPQRGPDENVTWRMGSRFRPFGRCPITQFSTGLTNTIVLKPLTNSDDSPSKGNVPTRKLPTKFCSSVYEVYT